MLTSITNRFTGSPSYPVTPNNPLRLLSPAMVTKTSALTAASAQGPQILSTSLDVPTQNETILFPTTDAAGVAASGLCYAMPRPHNRFQVGFFGAGADNAVFVANIWIGKLFENTKTMMWFLAAKLAPQLGATTGTDLSALENEYRMADVITVSNDYTNSSCVTLYNTADGCAMVELDGRGADIYRIDLSNSTGGSNPTACNGFWTVI